jgi:hypothetical protein
LSGEASARDRVSKISLRLWDAKRDVGALLGSCGLNPLRSCIAGEPRTSPRGAVLEGVWDKSYAFVRLPFPDGSTLKESLEHVLDGIEPFSDQIVGFVDSGGEAELFVGWHFDDNSGETVGWRLSRRLADYRLNLSLDIYPERDWLEEIIGGEA